MLKFLVFLTLASSASSNAILPSQPEVSRGTQSIGRSDEAPGIPSLQHNFPGFPEYASKYEEYQLIPVGNPQRTWLSTVATSLAPLGNFALTYGSRAILLTLQFVVLMLVGILLTTSLCTFTPFCAISFRGLGLAHDSVREHVKELARTYISPEALNITSSLVATAVDKYVEDNRPKDEEKKPKTGGNPERRRRRR